nr:MAG TPA: hypothetical protein [Caudoviricetes sp.]
MKDFWIVCKWDMYYPLGDIRNIVLVTFDQDEALRVKQEYQDKGGFLTDYDYCEIFHSSTLPWSNK